MLKRQKRCSSKQDKNLSFFCAQTLQLDDTTVPLSDCQKPRCSLYSTLSVGKFISQTSITCCYQIRWISSVRKYFSTEATVELVTSLILSRLNYCYSVLSGMPASSVHSLRRIQNCAVRFILKNP